MNEKFGQFVRNKREEKKINLRKLAENKEAVQAYFDGFGGEENYWKQMEATIMQNLTIHKYLNEQAANEKEIEEIKEKAYTEALTIDEEKELIRIANGIYE